MKPIDMGNNIGDMTWEIPLIRHATLGYLKIDIGIAKIGTGDIAIS